jgi:hypothetical protein
MSRVKSRIDCHSHLQRGKSGRRLLISDGRQWGVGSVGLALRVSYYSFDLTSSLQIHYLSKPSLTVLCRLLRSFEMWIDDLLGLRSPLESKSDRGGGRLGGIALSWGYKGRGTVYSGSSNETN